MRKEESKKPRALTCIHKKYRILRNNNEHQYIYTFLQCIDYKKCYFLHFWKRSIFNLGTSNRARLVRLQWLTWISLLFDTKIDFCLTNELCFIYLRPTFLTAKVNSIFSVFVLVLESFIAVINLSSLYGKQIHAYKNCLENT